MGTPAVRQDGIARYLRIEKLLKLAGLCLQKPHTEQQDLCKGRCYNDLSYDDISTMKLNAIDRVFGGLKWGCEPSEGGVTIFKSHSV